MAAVAAARPTVSVYSIDSPDTALDSLPLPDVFLSPIRPDLITFTHTQLNKNARQAYAVKHMAGMDTAADSWGTGRAVSRIPRVPGGGTHRAGQGALGNMCRGGRMFAPTKIYRLWHRKLAVKQRRYAVCSALAASAVPSLLLARGHRISDMPEVPLVLDGSVNQLVKTKQALNCLKLLGLESEVLKVKDSKKLRAGAGKQRNRRYTQRKGPLFVHDELENHNSQLVKAFRNIPGVDFCNVKDLSVLVLAPGGHAGRLVIWTKDAFSQLNTIFGTRDSVSELKARFSLPRSLVTNSDLSRLINSDEVQKVVRPVKSFEVSLVPKKLKNVNPLKNMKVMNKLNPYHDVLRRKQIKIDSDESKRKKFRAENAKERRTTGTKREQRNEFFKSMTQ